MLEWSVLLIDNSNRRFVLSFPFFSFNFKNCILYSMLIKDNLCYANCNRPFICSGSMEFVVPPADSSVFFPISVRFSATNTFSDLKVMCSSFLFQAITMVLERQTFFLNSALMVVIYLHHFIGKT